MKQIFVGVVLFCFLVLDLSASEYYWNNGSRQGSEYYWENGTGPNSQFIIAGGMAGGGSGVNQQAMQKKSIETIFYNNA